MKSGKQRLDCACAVGLGFEPLVFILLASICARPCFNDFWVEKMRLLQKSGGRGGAQLIEFRNKTLTTCDLESLLPLRYGGLYVQPGGLVPRARGRMTESMLEALASHAKSSSIEPGDRRRGV